MLALCLAAASLAADVRPAVPLNAPRMNLPRPATDSKLLALRGGGTAPSFADAAPMATVMALHGAALGVCAYYSQSTFGAASAAILVASAGMAVSSNFPAYMTGVHIALLLQVGSAGVFGVQAARCGLAQLQGAKMCAMANALPVYSVMSAGSVATLGAMKKFKPKKKVVKK